MILTKLMTSMEGELHTYVDDNYAPNGDGIMLRATYDTDNDGAIDRVIMRIR